MMRFSAVDFRNVATLTCLLALGVSASAQAGPADYLYTPRVEKGEKEIDSKFGTAKDQEGERETVSTLGVGYGVTDYWFTEAYLKFEHEEGDTLRLFEWENKFQFTKKEEFPVEIGLITEIEAPLNEGNEPWELKLGPLFQTDVGKFRLNANVLFERKFDGDDDVEHITELGYQWQVKYKFKHTFEFGLQGMGEVGEWDHWAKHDEQNHRMGPVVYGEVEFDQKRELKFNVGWLFGVSEAAPDHTLRAQIEYEF